MRPDCSAAWLITGDGGDDAATGCGETSAISETPMMTPNGFDSRCDRTKKNAPSEARIAIAAARARAGAMRLFSRIGIVVIAGGPKLRVKAVRRSAFCKDA